MKAPSPIWWNLSAAFWGAWGFMSLATGRWQDGLLQYSVAVAHWHIASLKEQIDDNA